MSASVTDCCHLALNILSRAEFVVSRAGCLAETNLCVDLLLQIRELLSHGDALDRKPALDKLATISTEPISVGPIHGRSVTEWAIAFGNHFANLLQGSKQSILDLWPRIHLSFAAREKGEQPKNGGYAATFYRRLEDGTTVMGLWTPPNIMELQAYRNKVAWELAQHAPQEQPLKDEPALSERQYEVLDVLCSLKAFAPHVKTTTEEISKKLKVDSAALKEPISKLAKRQLVQTKRGRTGGIWLSRAGQELVERHRKT